MHISKTDSASCFGVPSETEALKGSSRLEILSQASSVASAANIPKSGVALPEALTASFAPIAAPSPMLAMTFILDWTAKRIPQEACLQPRL